MSYSINPLSDRVVIEAAEADEVSTGGIILPDTAQEKPQRGKVVAVGPGRTTDSGTLVSPSVSVNDEVLYGKYSGTEINIDGSDLLIVRENDIMAKL
ncbi:co-chaperone GroES [Candidatus Woesearchaeota archaeon]|jgi:chaperonin GroES|nr:co-chaperone GroES [Candidatus Woesearchaeota archaeon]MBT7556449.1 co-chaperone GroES [Candidatus Woesearchaeota archaeon]